VRSEELRVQSDWNAEQAARNSLDSLLTHWPTGQSIRARDWIADLIEQVTPTAKQYGFGCFLSPLHTILDQGNEAQRWLAAIQAGQDVATVVQQAIQTMHAQELALVQEICSAQAA
jgi:predicted glutamate--cysteine ligase